MGVDNFQVTLDSGENCLIKSADDLKRLDLVEDHSYIVEPLHPRFSLSGTVSFHSDTSRLIYLLSTESNV